MHQTRKKSITFNPIIARTSMDERKSSVSYLYSEILPNTTQQSNVVMLVIVKATNKKEGMVVEKLESLSYEAAAISRSVAERPVDKFQPNNQKVRF